jgi:ketosteroid isomerase-like protein
MTLAEKTDLVRRSFAAYMSAARADIEAILHPDFTFTSPYDDHIERHVYFARCWPTPAASNTCKSSN